MYPSDEPSNGLFGFSGNGGDSLSGGPPPADQIFESLGGDDGAEASPDQAIDVDPDHLFLTVGLHFFEKIRDI